MWKYLFIILIGSSNIFAEETQSEENKNTQNQEDITEAENIAHDHSKAEKQMLIDYSKGNFTDPYDRWPDITGWVINNLYGFIMPIQLLLQNLL